MGNVSRSCARFFAHIVIASSLVLVPTMSQQPPHETKGSIVAIDGIPIGGVLVVTSGKGFAGWATSDADGSFRLPTAGEFISFRHANYNPVLVRSSDLANPIRIQLAPADETLWKLKSCNSLPGKGRGWIGSGLRLNPGGAYKTGQGEHDSHWYVKRGTDTLHLVDGYAWHAGLPLERILSGSETLSVRGWVFDNIVGLDLSGHTREGKYWRWVGAPVAEAIEYETVSRATADDFDGIVSTLCFGSR